MELDHNAHQSYASKPIKVVFTAQSLALLSDRVQVFQPTDTVLMIQHWLMDELMTMSPTATIDPLKQMHFLGHYPISAELSLHALMTISSRVTITVLSRYATLHDQCRFCFGQYVLSYDTSLDTSSEIIQLLDNVEASADRILDKF